MGEFKILNNPKESSYFGEPNWTTDKEEYNYQCSHFMDYVQVNFINELKKHSDIKKQAGYSKKRDCNYISLILVLSNTGDGSFVGHSVHSTCLVEQNGRIRDVNNNKDESDEVGHFINTIYHQLPNGELIEYQLEQSYEDEIENIYENIKKIRSYHELNIELPANQVKKEKKLKL